MSWAGYTQFGLDGFNIDPCVFEVPERLKATNPDAYAPRQVGLGPYHHCQPKVQQMTNRKREAAKSYLEALKIDIGDFVKEVERRAAALEPINRLCYDRHIDLDGESLAWIIIVDAIFLLDFVLNYNGGCNVEFDNEEQREMFFSNYQELVPDIMMLENQIPLLFMGKVLHGFCSFLGMPKHERDEYWVLSEVCQFCDKISPFGRASISREAVDSAIDPAIDGTKNMLHIMYRLSLGTYTAEYSAEKDGGHDDKGRLQHLVAVTWFVMSRAKGIVGFAAGQVASAFGIAKSGGVQMSEKVDKMFTSAGNIQKILSSDTKIDQQRSLLPSVSELSDVVQTTFHLSDNPGIRGTHFDKTRNEFSLPGMTLHENSEVILRNLLAYEATLPDEVPKEIANFVSFLCTIIIAEKDVKILSDAQIIKGKLSENEVVVLFNSLKTSITASGVLERNKKSSSSLDDFGSQLRQQFINNPVVKACSRTTNCCVFFFNSLTPLVPMFVVLLLLFQSFCEIYDCRRSSPSASSQAYYPFTDSSFLSFNTTSDLAELISARKILRYSS